MATPLTTYNPVPSGVIARYVGSSGGSTTRYYWVQAIYPSGNSLLGQSNLLTTIAGLDHNNQVYIEWNPMGGAIGYNVYYTTTTTVPTTGAIFLAAVTAPNFTDQGQSSTPGTANVIIGGGALMLAHAQYNFATDGGAIATITLALSDLIPAGAVLTGGYANPTTALTSGGSATIGIGVTAGLSSPTVALKAAAAVATYSVDALLPLIPTFAVPLKMTASGTITITVATATLTAGVMDIFVYYTMPVSL